MLLETLTIILVALHFGVPLAYYVISKKYARGTWHLTINEEYTPNLAVLVPTHNESRVIDDRLNNMFAQEYPKEKMQLIVADDGSTDRTPEIVERWIQNNPTVTAKLVRTQERKGKTCAINNALDTISGNTEIVMLGDADCLWQQDAVRKAVKYFSDPIVGALTCSISPANGSGPGVSLERNYRRFFNVIRVAESKIWSTPISHGGFVAYRRECLMQLGGIPYGGADDSTPFTLIAINGRRSIQVSDIWVYESVPNDLKSNLNMKLRRAQHITGHFMKILGRIRSTHNPFRRILWLEFYLYVVNPWILLAALALALVGIISSYPSSLASMYLPAMTLGAMMLAFYPPFRVWILTQSLLIAAAVRYFLKGELRMWEPPLRQLNSPSGDTNTGIAAEGSRIGT